MLGSSEWSSRCESGWTLYLDHSLSSSTSPSCSRDIISRFRERTRRRSRSKISCEEEEEEEDMSMISDASSGPMNVSEEESVKKMNKFGVEKECNGEKRGSKDEKLGSFLDDTASSPFYNFSHKSVVVGGGNEIEERFAESESDYSQGFSATQFQMGVVESQFNEPTYIFNTSNPKTITKDSLDKIPKV